jgi:hypothetical protein
VLQVFLCILEDRQFRKADGAAEVVYFCGKVVRNLMGRMGRQELPPEADKPSTGAAGTHPVSRNSSGNARELCGLAGMVEDCLDRTWLDWPSTSTLLHR